MALERDSEESQEDDFTNQLPPQLLFVHQVYLGLSGISYGNTSQFYVPLHFHISIDLYLRKLGKEYKYFFYPCKITCIELNAFAHAHVLLQL